MSIRDNLKYLLVKRVLKAIEVRSIKPTKYRVLIKGFGDFKSLAVISEVETRVRVRRSLCPTFSEVSLSELQKESSKLTFGPTRFSFRSRVRRFLSIAIQSGKFSIALTSSFVGKINIDAVNFSKVPYLTLNDSSSVWLSRLASRSGFYNSNVRPSLEYDFRRNTQLYNSFITHISVTPQTSFFFIFFRFFDFAKIVDLLVEKSDIESAISLSKIMPRWHYVNSFFTMQFNEDVFFAENIYEITSAEDPAQWHLSYLNEPNALALEKQVCFSSPDFLVLKLTESFVYFADSVLIDGKLLGPETQTSTERLKNYAWPSFTWSVPTSRYISIPNFLGEIELQESALVMGNPGWGHFIEEEVPRFIKLSEISESKRIPIVANLYGNAQHSLISYLIRSNLVLLNPGYKYALDSGYLVILKNFRKNASNGHGDFFSSDTESILSQARKTIVKAVSNTTLPTRVYIARESGLFRDLRNKDKIERALVALNFVKIYTSDLSIPQRLEIFGNADIVVGESGSGLFNLYFANKGCTLIEIRHPDLEVSRESDLMVKVVGLNHRIVLGKRLEKLRIASPLKDDYVVDLTDLETTLEGLI